jgi:hypothetical protein
MLNNLERGLMREGEEKNVRKEEKMRAEMELRVRLNGKIEMIEKDEVEKNPVNFPTRGKLTGFACLICLCVSCLICHDSLDANACAN